MRFGLYSYAEDEISRMYRVIKFAKLYKSSPQDFRHSAFYILHSTLQNGNRAFSENALLSFCTYFIHKFLLPEIAF